MIIIKMGFLFGFWVIHSQICTFGMMLWWFDMLGWFFILFWLDVSNHTHFSLESLLGGIHRDIEFGVNNRTFLFFCSSSFFMIFFFLLAILGFFAVFPIFKLLWFIELSGFVFRFLENWLKIPNDRVTLFNLGTEILFYFFSDKTIRNLFSQIIGDIDIDVLIGANELVHD